MDRFRSMSGCAMAFVFLSSINAVASTDTIGPNGINSEGLLDFNQQPLTGAGVVIGQVEVGRPGDAEVGDDPDMRNTFINPADVFERDDPGDPPDELAIRNHSEQVAGVMISTDTTDLPPNADGDAPKGVATGASLYSSAFITESVLGYRDAILTTQFIATRPGMRAVNHSWGKVKVDPGDALDGNSQVTLATSVRAPAQTEMVMASSTLPTMLFGATISAREAAAD